MLSLLNFTDTDCKSALMGMGWDKGIYSELLPVTNKTK